MNATNTPTLLRLPQVIERTGLTRSGVYELMAANDFPRQIALSARCVAWVDAEIDQWVRNRIANART